MNCNETIWIPNFWPSIMLIFTVLLLLLRLLLLLLLFDYECNQFEKMSLLPWRQYKTFFKLSLEKYKFQDFKLSVNGRLTGLKISWKITSRISLNFFLMSRWHEVKNRLPFSMGARREEGQWGDPSPLTGQKYYVIGHFLRKIECFGEIKWGRFEEV